MKVTSAVLIDDTPGCGGVRKYGNVERVPRKLWRRLVQRVLDERGWA